MLEELERIAELDELNELDVVAAALELAGTLGAPAEEPPPLPPPHADVTEKRPNKKIALIILMVNLLVLLFVETAKVFCTNLGDWSQAYLKQGFTCNAFVKNLIKLQKVEVFFVLVEVYCSSPGARS